MAIDGQIIGFVLGIGGLSMLVGLMALWTALSMRRECEAQILALRGEVAHLAYQTGAREDGGGDARSGIVGHRALCALCGVWHAADYRAGYAVLRRVYPLLGWPYGDQGGLMRWPGRAMTGGRLWRLVR